MLGARIIPPIVHAPGRGDGSVIRTPAAQAGRRFGPRSVVGGRHVNEFPRGSEWRKWDLHVHVPGTALNDQYASTGSEPVLDEFTDVLAASDVAVIGLTDYFSLDGSLACIAHFQERHRSSNKLLIPNMEVRLSETVNAQQSEVNAHLLFRPDITAEQARRFMDSLKTNRTDASDRSLSVTEICEEGLQQSVVVSVAQVNKAFAETFGAERPRESMLVVVPARGDGIRPAATGALRKHHQAAEIDKWSDAIFGSADDVAFFLDPDRGAAERVPLRPKPVFSGSDSHSFDDLRTRLGKTTTGDRPSEITWVKADPTFDGLLQTLVEPYERVRIQATRPDFKEPYQVIRAVRFAGTEEFPQEVVLNPNLVSVIGSRSSGKSALLAYIAHAVDPLEALAQQRAASPEGAATPGPAAGKSWADVAHISCTIEWGDEEAGDGQVIYIPQNSLFALSTRPEDITAKIQPVLYRQSPELESLHHRVTQEVSGLNAELRAAVVAWFELDRAIDQSSKGRRSLGERAVVQSTVTSLEQQVSDLRASVNLSDEDAAAYGQLTDRIALRQAERHQLEADQGRLSAWLDDRGDSPTASDSISVSVSTTPRLHDLPPSLRPELEAVVEGAAESVRARLQTSIVAEHQRLTARHAELGAEDHADQTANAALIARNAANDSLQELTDRLATQRALVVEIDASDEELQALVRQRSIVSTDVTRLLHARAEEIDAFVQRFAELAPALDEMQFEVESGLTSEAIAASSLPMDFRQSNSFFDPVKQELAIARVRSEAGSFLEAVASGDIKLKTAQSKEGFTSEALTLTEEIRFAAKLQGDRIGGFGASSMTPGKQALFALTLILNESNHRWPLLIDQPEDDLDSRSIYQTIVPYLKERKRERQIIMVSHNANLVVGADSEQVVVANRHGEDRPNRDERTFEYISGSLEYTHAEPASPFVLESLGIREHACALLDGGEEAFRKRRDKYRMTR